MYDEKEAEFVAKRSSDVYLGNIIMVRENERIPADLIMLASEKQDGTAFIETSSLDGEKNLKAKKIAEKMEEIYPFGMEKGSTNPNCLDRLSIGGTCQAEARNDKLYEFTGMLRLQHEGQEFKIGQGAD